MDVNSIIDHLKYGELANTFLGDVDSIDVSAAHRLRIYSYIDLALTELNKRFNLNYTEHIIPLKENTCTYYIHDKQFLYVIGAYTNTGVELAINKEGSYNSIFTPTYNTIEFFGDPAVVPPVTSLSVIYLKNFDTISDKSNYIPISDMFLEAILAYIGSRATLSMTQNGQDVSTLYYQKFEAACSKVREFAASGIDDTYDTKLFSRGFV